MSEGWLLRTDLVQEQTFLAITRVEDHIQLVIDDYPHGDVNKDTVVGGVASGVAVHEVDKHDKDNNFTVVDDKVERNLSEQIAETRVKR